MYSTKVLSHTHMLTKKEIRMLGFLGFCLMLTTIFSFYNSFTGVKVKQLSSDITTTQSAIDTLERTLSTESTVDPKQVSTLKAIDPSRFTIAEVKTDTLSLAR